MGGTILWKDGRIFTGRRYVEAVLAEDGRVVAAGPTRTVVRAAGTGTQRVDLHGRLAVPGLVDAHLHLAETARAVVSADLRGARSLREVGERVRAWARKNPEGPLLGLGWEEAGFVEHRYPTAADLGEWVGDRPGALYRVCTHAAVVSPRLLETLGVRSDSPDPPGGRIGRDADGSPNGLLFDRALEPLSDWVDRSVSTRPEAMGRVLEAAAGLGLTTLGAVSASPAEVEATVGLARRTPLPARVVFYLRANDRARFGELRRRSRTDSTDLVGVKLVADGAFGPRTAWLTRPYHDAPQESGFALRTEPELRTILQEADAAGAALAVHAIGDRTLARVLDAFEALRPSRRPRIEHASLTPPSLLRRLRTVRPLLVVQPGFVPSDSWIVERLGTRRARWTYTFASFLRDGHAPAGSSDSPVEPLDPWLGVAAAVGPRAATGAPEQVDLESALRFYTVHGGEALGHPAVGHLDPGAVADLVVSRAPTLRAAVAMGAANVARVYRDGAPVGPRPAPGGG
ncbi:MAG: amidohydrolase [Thermoplasmata archaeon]|nr:amidohydrolase [Thermoplasmata archaeon]MCI4362113.1 amidohydrolase [Thermoplasmata archaeon]